MKYTREKYFGLGKVPIGIGAVLNGWNIPEEDFRNPDFLPVVDFRAMTSACDHNCPHCFTDKLKKTLTLEEIKRTIDQIADLGGKAIDYLGEGEPTKDRDFFEIIEYTAAKGIQPIIFTDGATKMRNRDFVKRVKETGASVVPKCDSFWNPEYQNSVVGDKKGKYFAQRNEALELLLAQDFNKLESDGTTRLGFDVVISRRNIHEVERTLRFCRNNNLWVVFSFFLPAGRSGKDTFDNSLRPSKEEKQTLRETVRRIDREYGFDHKIYNNFATFPCVEFMCIYGDGRVSPCVGNEAIMGNIKTEQLRSIRDKILKEYPCHNTKTFDGHCLYRPKIEDER